MGTNANERKPPDTNKQRPYNLVYIKCKRGQKSPMPFDIRTVTTFRWWGEGLEVPGGGFWGAEILCFLAGLLLTQVCSVRENSRSCAVNDLFECMQLRVV